MITIKTDIIIIFERVFLLLISFSPSSMIIEQMNITIKDTSYNIVLKNFIVSLNGFLIINN